ncbi:MAG: twin-arginine translocation signal domain-containing protein, partial [Bryobacteraceae bacterium]
FEYLKDDIRDARGIGRGHDVRAKPRMTNASLGLLTLSRRAFVKGAAALIPAAGILSADPLEKSNLGVQRYFGA